MAIDRGILDQLRHLMRPVAVRVANTVVRGVVQLVDDSLKLQLLQLGGLANETIDGAEHHQPYGFTSVPLPGAEHVTIFPGGDRSHPLTIAVSDRRYRPTGGQPGDVTLYNAAGAKVTMLATGDVEIQPAPGGKVLVDDGSGAAALPTMADLAGIISIMNSAGTGAATALPAAVTTYQAAHPTWPDGTKVIEGK